MRLLLQSWKKTWVKLGKKAVRNPRKRFQRRLFIETLEERRMLTEFAYLGEALTTCSCSCSCSDATATDGGGAKTEAGLVGYNSSSQSHPVMMFGFHAFSFSIMTRMEVDLTIGTTQLDTVYFGAAPEGAEWVVFGIQIDTSSMASGIYDWQFDFRLYSEASEPDPYYSDTYSSNTSLPG